MYKSRQSARSHLCSGVCPVSRIIYQRSWSKTDHHLSDMGEQYVVYGYTEMKLKYQHVHGGLRRPQEDELRRT